MSTIVEPSPSTFARTLASNRSRAVARTDSFTTTPTRPAMNGATHTSGRLPKSASRAAGVDDRRLDDVRRDLDARHEVAALDDLAVEDREDLERVEPVEPLELRDPDVDDARRRGQQVHPALVRAADLEARAGDGRASRRAASSSWSSPASSDQDRDRRPVHRRVGERREVVGGQPPALRPALARRRVRSRGEDGPGQALRRAADRA